MIDLTVIDNSNLAKTLGVFLVILIWLFFFRVIRAVWVEVRPPRSLRAATTGPETRIPAATPPSRVGRRSRLVLRVVEPDPERGRVYELPDEVTVGRAPGCGVRVDDAYTSSIHARIYRRDGTLWVEDLGSTNGTWLNGDRISAPSKADRGDLVQVGGTVFEVSR
ncbi:MAG: FHA domain-containing protein [Acidimicrobiales bacterium]